MFPNQIKCVIWDLDETLWGGSLAENDQIKPRNEIIDLIKRLDQKGIINSICSKNNYQEAKEELKALGVWDYFVFPIIDFVPKGQSIKNIINNLQLRPANVLFVDDNVGNRNEVKYYCDTIMVADANDEYFIDEINNVLKEVEGKSRLERYKTLEAKHKAQEEYVDNNDFLNDSDITVCILRNPTDLTFQKRIYDLANRTNQLNFTKSRFPTYEMFENYLDSQDSMFLYHGIVFVYDKYGDYGLVGFFAFDERKERRELDHFYFSCRILNMGVEQAVYKYLRENCNIKKHDLVEKKLNIDTSYIRIIHDLDQKVKDYINNKMEMSECYRTVVSAGCESGIIGHYLSDATQPARFDSLSITDEEKTSDDVEFIIYTIYSDYINLKWRNCGGFSYRKFQLALRLFIERHPKQQIYLILASEKKDKKQAQSLFRKIRFLLSSYFHGKSRVRCKRCNAIVRENTACYSNVKLIETTEFVKDRKEQFDPRHFERVVLIKNM